MTDLFEASEIACDPSECRPFIDSSTGRLKAVLLHNGDIYPSLLLAHSKALKEVYSSAKILPDILKYEEYDWGIIGDFNIIAFLMSVQSSFTQFSCYLCL